MSYLLQLSSTSNCFFYGDFDPESTQIVVIGNAATYMFLTGDTIVLLRSISTDLCCITTEISAYSVLLVLL